MQRLMPVTKSLPIVTLQEANQTAVHGSRRDRLDRLPLSWCAGGGRRASAMMLAPVRVCIALVARLKFWISLLMRPFRYTSPRLSLWRPGKMDDARTSLRPARAGA